jgi:hypothetical protein
MTEQETLERYSTPGLRKHELSRAEKKAHLAGMKIVGEDAEKILAQLYPECLETAAAQCAEIREMNSKIEHKHASLINEVALRETA